MKKFLSILLSCVILACCSFQTFALDDVDIDVGESNGKTGDINMDGNVDLKDTVILMQYVLEYDVSVDMDLVDANGDDEVNIKDAFYLSQCIFAE